MSFCLVMQRFSAVCCSTWPRWLMHCSFRSSRLALCRALSVRALLRNRGGLSEARGGKRVCAIVARVVLSSFALLGAFILSSVVLYCLNCAIVLDAQQYFNLNNFCYRLLLASVVCLAYVVSGVIAVSYFGSGFGPIGMLLLVNVVAIYIQLGANSMLPLPSSMLMWICGVTPLGNSQCLSILIDCLINVASVFTICYTVDRLRSRFL